MADKLKQPVSNTPTGHALYLQERHVWSLCVDVFTKLLERVAHNDVLVTANMTVNNENGGDNIASNNCYIA